MKHCGFCGDIEIGTADLCQKCGYKLKEIQTLYSSDGRIDYEPLHSQLEKIDTITIGFKKRWFERHKYQRSYQIQIGYFDFWNQLYNAYHRGHIKFNIEGNTIVFDTSITTQNTKFTSLKTLHYIPDNVKFVQELMFDQYDPSTGLNVYKLQKMSRGGFSIQQLSQVQRKRFLIWLLKTPPHASAEGKLCFEI